MRALLGGVLGLLLGSGLAAEDKKDEKIDATKLIGKWRLKEDKQSKDEALFWEFGKDGKLTTTLKFGGKEEKDVEPYKVEGNTLIVTEKIGGKEEPIKSTILKLTDTELVVRKGKAKEADTFVRVKDK
jgi:uncharacterized protein (TIGR03066 family)